MASRQRSRYTRSFQSGMRLPSGQPLLQKGMPQSMQREACVFSARSAKGSYTSFQSRSRTGTGRRVGTSRPCFRNPLTSPMDLSSSLACGELLRTERNALRAC